MVEIVRLKEVSERAVADINKLLPQLRTDPSEYSASITELRSITEDNDVALVVALDSGHIIGMATLYIITKFSKRNGHVEDVVVDSGYRGQGLGEKIMHKIIEIARDEHVKTLHLTSRPDRSAANKLYQKLGFEQKDTNAYFMKL